MIEKELEKRGYVFDRNQNGYVLNFKKGSSFVVYDLEKRTYQIKDKDGNNIGPCYQSIGFLDNGNYLQVAGNGKNIFDIRKSKFLFPKNCYDVDMLNEKREIFGFVLIGSELKKNRDFQVNICTADGKILFSKNNIFCMSVKGAENLIYIASRDDYSEMILNLDTKNICNLGQCRVAKEVEILNKKGDLIKITDYEREIYNNVRVYDLKTGKKLCDLCRYTEWLNKDETLLKCTYNYPTAMYNVRNYVFNIDNEKIITTCKCKDVRIFDKEQTLLEVSLERICMAYMK